MVSAQDSESSRSGVSPDQCHYMYVGGVGRLNLWCNCTSISSRLLNPT